MQSGGINFLGYDDLNPSQQTKRIKVKNNLFDDIGGTRWGGNGRLFQLIDGTADIHIDHNTAFQTYNAATADGRPHTGFVYTNNLSPHNDYGFIGSGHSDWQRYAHQLFSCLRLFKKCSRRRPGFYLSFWQLLSLRE